MAHSERVVRMQGMASQAMWLEQETSQAPVSGQCGNVSQTKPNPLTRSAARHPKTKANEVQSNRDAEPRRRTTEPQLDSAGALVSPTERPNSYDYVLGKALSMAQSRSPSRNPAPKKPAVPMLTREHREKSFDCACAFCNIEAAVPSARRREKGFDCACAVCEIEAARPSARRREKRFDCACAVYELDELKAADSSARRCEESFDCACAVCELEAADSSARRCEESLDALRRKRSGPARSGPAARVSQWWYKMRESKEKGPDGTK